MKILIIDDCSISRNILAKQLESFGECHTAVNGIEAVNMFQQAIEKNDPYRLVCLDISMPEMDGCEVLDTIRSIEKETAVSDENKVKVIIITAFDDDDNFLRTYQSCQGYLVKPIRKAMLFEKVTSLGFKQTAPLSSPGALISDISETVSGFDYSDMIPLLTSTNGHDIEFLIKNRTENGIEQRAVRPDKLEFFKNVIAGQMLARLENPSVPLKAGEGIAFNPQKLIFSAQKSGRVLYSDGVLSICDTLFINETVKFENIYFLGKVEIHGDVMDGLKIHGERGIRIIGSVGACELRSDSDVYVERMNGKHKGSIKCGGRVHAKFLHNTLVECRNDITVDVEVIDSVLKSGSCIRASAVAGGECIAFDLVEVKRAGSSTESPTLIKSGYNFYQLDRKKTIESNLKEIEGRIFYIDQMLGPSGAELGKSLLMPDAKQKKIYAFLSEKNHLESSRAEFTKELERINMFPLKRNDSQIIIQELLHKGVKLEYNDMEETVFETIKGPVTIDKKLIQL